MGVYLGPVCRLCRREGEKLYLKGDRCYSAKCSVEKRKYPPGQHGQNQRKIGEYGVQLREKQKLRRIYGVLETQFQNYFHEAERRRGLTGENLLQLLEVRLDNVIYRMGLGRSRREARQLVSHGHISVNGRRVTIASMLVKPGTRIEVTASGKDLPQVRLLGHSAGGRKVPEWMSFDEKNVAASILSMPSRDQIDTDVREQLVVEFYSR
ncbi:MAG TPA: 30S ribosomal protein S4 [Armatimonadota bacterium]|jgi:small subunit ribosomal protein S4